MARLRAAPGGNNDTAAQSTAAVPKIPVLAPPKQKEESSQTQTQRRRSPRKTRPLRDYSFYEDSDAEEEDQDENEGSTFLKPKLGPGFERGSRDSVSTTPKRKQRVLRPVASNSRLGWRGNDSLVGDSILDASDEDIRRSARKERLGRGFGGLGRRGLGSGLGLGFRGLGIGDDDLSRKLGVLEVKTVKAWGDEETGEKKPKGKKASADRKEKSKQEKTPEVTIKQEEIEECEILPSIETQEEPELEIPCTQESEVGIKEETPEDSPMDIHNGTAEDTDEERQPDLQDDFDAQMQAEIEAQLQAEMQEQSPEDVPLESIETVIEEEQAQDSSEDDDAEEEDGEQEYEEDEDEDQKYEEEQEEEDDYAHEDDDEDDDDIVDARYRRRQIHARPKQRQKPGDGEDEEDDEQMPERGISQADIEPPVVEARCHERQAPAEMPAPLRSDRPRHRKGHKTISNWAQQVIDLTSSPQAPASFVASPPQSDPYASPSRPTSSYSNDGAHILT
jgi:hypothetical protein